MLSQSDLGTFSIISLHECKFIVLPKEEVTAFFTEQTRKETGYTGSE